MRRLRIVVAGALLVLAGAGRANTRSTRTTESDAVAVKYLVVSHENWCDNPGLESLLQWHKRRGAMTRLIHKAGWSAQEIKDSIYAEYTRHDPAALRWVLLVGEFAEIPMAAMGGVQYGDYWYSDLLPPGMPDNYPEVGLARLSPSSATDLENQTTKILTYERNPPATRDWLTKTVLVASDSTTGILMRRIYSQPRSFWRYDFDTLMWWRQSGNESIAAAINQGRGVVAYKGHGDWDQWYSLAGQWNVSDINALTNGDLTPVVFNIAPSCGDIYQGICLSEAWLRKYPGGAVASFAATQASFTAPNSGMCSTAVACLCDTGRISVPGLRDYLLPAFDIGGIQCNVDAYVARYWPGSPYPDNIYMYLMLGDPAMEVWSGGLPQTPNVVYDSVVPLGPYNLAVGVTADGRAVSNALVCAWKDTEFYVTGCTDDNGSVTLTTNALTPGRFRVTVSSGHCATQPHLPILPFEGFCTATRLNYDIAVLRLLPPSETVPVGTGITPSCTLFNYGSITANYVVRYYAGPYRQDVPVFAHVPGTYMGVTFPTWVTGDTGMYVQACSAFIHDENPANDWKVDTIWFVPGVGIKDAGMNPSLADRPMLTVSPNPCRGRARISVLQSAVCNLQSEIRIYDAKGRLVRRLALRACAWAQVDLRDLPDGVYLVRLQNGNKESETKRIVLIR